MRIRYGLALLLITSVLGFGFGLLGTTQNAVVTGDVYYQGKLVPGAVAHLINPGTGLNRQQDTDSSGKYIFVEVPPAENYVMSVEKEGFIPAALAGITIQVGEQRLVLPPFLLEAKTAATPATAKKEERLEQSVGALDLLSTTLGGVVDGRTVRTLPLAGRDFIDLALLTPGTYPVEQGSVLEGASLVVNGARPNMNNFLLDGVDNNDYTINQSLPFQIVEAMDQFRVQAGTSPAEFGRSGGAQINAISREGLNTVHGSLFWFVRNSYLRADNFFSAYNGGSFDKYVRTRRLLGEPDPLADPALRKIYDQRNPHLSQNQFGANLGGALKKDKIFGFFNWESFRVSNPRPAFERVPGLYLRGLDNTLFRGVAQFIFGRSGDPHPLAAALYRLYPLPNVPTTGKSSGNAIVDCSFRALVTDPNCSAFAVGQSRNQTHSDNFLERIDVRLGGRDSMSFKHNVQRIEQIQGGSIPTSAVYPGNGTNVMGRNQNFSYNFLHQFGPRSTNEFRFGWIRFHLDEFAQDRKIDPASLGFKELTFHDRGLPSLTVGGLDFLGALASFSSPYAVLGADESAPSLRVSNVWSLSDNYSLLRGRHNWKFGFEFRKVRLNVTNEALGRGVMGFFEGLFVAYTGRPDAAAIARAKPEFWGGFDRAFLTRSYDWFIQDQWRPRSNFTLNYGVRYEANVAPYELRNRLVNFYPALGGLVQSGSTQIFDLFGNPTGRTAKSPAPRAGFETDKNNFAPRIGLAWDPGNNGKMVVRAGYAVVFDQQPLEPSVNMLLNPPFVQQDFAFFPTATLDNVFGRDLPDNEWLELPFSITARDPATRSTYMQQFHAGIQRQLGKAQVEAAYVGTLGRKLPRLRDLSTCTPQKFAASPGSCFDVTQKAFFTPTLLNEENTANSDFHSLQLRFDTRAFHGLQLRLHYLWAKSIDNSSSLGPQVFLVPPEIASLLSAPSAGFAIQPDNFAGANNISPALSLRPALPVITTRPRLPQDSNNLSGERGLSDFDARHRLIINYIYDLPTWMPVIGRNWHVAGITTVQSGQPYTVFADFFGIPLRPNLLRRPTTDNDNPLAAIDNGAAAGSAKSAFSFSDLKPGNLGRNTFRGPNLVTFDFAVLKEGHLGERTVLQFRAEFFNLFNRANFRQPVSQLGVLSPDLDLVSGKIITTNMLLPNPYFGQIIQARPAREVQLALKLIF